MTYNDKNIKADANKPEKKTEETKKSGQRPDQEKHDVKMDKKNK